MARRDVAAAKQARQRKIAIAGFVVLLAVMAFSVPKTLKMMKGPQPTSAPAAAPVSAATPVPAVEESAPVAVAELVDTDVAPQPAEGQLISFEQFEGKDPFAQQVEEGAVQAEGATPTAPAAAPAAPDASAAAPAPLQPETPDVAAPSLPVPTTTHPGTPAATPTPQQEPAPAPKPTSALLSINGVRETVAAKADFPAVDKVFELRSIGADQVKVGIAGGTLTGGSQTVTLKKGKKITLVNTADGTRYELVLVSVA